VVLGVCSVRSGECLVCLVLGVGSARVCVCVGARE